LYATVSGTENLGEVKWQDKKLQACDDKKKIGDEMTPAIKYL